MFQLRHLKTFLAAAETLNFTKAAEHVHLSQPSVTGQIQSLEESLGEPLFIRSNNKLTLTQAGRNLAVRASALLAMADEAELAIREGRESHAGSIRVAAPHTLCATLLTPAAVRYARSHAEVQLSVHEKNSSETERAVLEHDVDIGVVHGWPRRAAGLEVEVISRDLPVVVMAAAHPLGAAAEVTWEKLAAAAVLLTPSGCRYREYAETLLRQAPVQPRIQGEADSVSTLVQMIAAGLGVSILPGKAIDHAKAGAHVWARPLANPGNGLPICMLTAPASATTRAARAQLGAFMDMVRGTARASDEPVPSFDVENSARGEATG